VEKIKSWVTEEGGVWTLEKMRLRLEQEEGISVTQQAIWYRLKESDWSWKTGRPSNPGKDEEAGEAFRESGLSELVDEGKRVLFTDSMRYGLISNPWRNWGPVGERVTVPKQMEFEWGYLWAEIDVVLGEFNVWLLPEMNGEVLSPVVQQMPERWGDDLGIVWDNSPVHKSVAKSLPGTISCKFLPAYSPELNPVERFFEELRRRIANRIFSSLSELEDALVEAMDEFFGDTFKVRKLCGYPWILQQLQPEKDVALIS
jgi:transposase